MRLLNINISPIHQLMMLAVILTGMAFPATFGRCLEGTEDQIKGAMMVNFIKFIQWPDHVTEQTGGKLTIGIFGRDSFGQTLDHLEGRTIGDYRLSIRRFDNLDQLSQCQMLFICESETQRVPQILSEVAGLPILTIGEDEDFLRSGGIIRFYMDKKHVRFEINKTAAQEADLKISAKLIEIASAFE